MDCVNNDLAEEIYGIKTMQTVQMLVMPLVWNR